jgi:hypothetical protein
MADLKSELVRWQNIQEAERHWKACMGTYEGTQQEKLEELTRWEEAWKLDQFIARCIYESVNQVELDDPYCDVRDTSWCR